jgi:CheY-like chemotaxis protein
MGNRLSRDPKILCSKREGLFALGSKERGAVQHVFAIAAALSKPKYNSLALDFVSSSWNGVEYHPAPKGFGSLRISTITSPGAGGRMPKAKPLISIVDDDESMREAVKGLMKSLGYRVAAAASGQEFLNSRHVRRTSCLITDMQMPGMTGLELHHHLSTSGKPIPTILITAYPDDSVRERALAAGVIGYLSKPFDEGDLLACICSALTTRP